MGTNKKASLAADAARELEQIVSDALRIRTEIARLHAEQARVFSRAVDYVIRHSVGSDSHHSSASDLALREVSAELGRALCVSDRTVQARMSDAFTLVSQYPQTLSALEQGEIDQSHARIIAETGCLFTDDGVRAVYENLTLDLAKELTPARLTPAARTIAARLDPAAEVAAHKRAHESRGVRVIDLGEGMARLLADLPAPLAHAIHDRLTHYARTLADTQDAATTDDDGDALSAAAGRSGTADSGAADSDAADSGAADSGAADSGAADSGAADSGAAAPDAAAPGTADSGAADSGAANPGAANRGAAAPDAAAPGTDRDTPSDTRGIVTAADERTLAQLRADVLADLLLSGMPDAHRTDEAITGRVQVTIPVATLTGLGNELPHLAGYGPISTADALHLAARAPGWDRIFVHPGTGIPQTVDRYRPTAEQRRLLAIRDEHCRFPGCRMPIVRTDIDHTEDFATGGRTTLSNLAHLCRRHHTLKHNTRWRVTQGADGTLTWTSPLGMTRADRPASRVRFVPGGTGSASTADPLPDDPPF